MRAKLSASRTDRRGSDSCLEDRELDQAWLALDDSAFEAIPRSGAHAGPFLGRVLVRALRDHLTVTPTDSNLRDKPIMIRLEPPLPPRLRVYLYAATQHSSERQAGTFRIQLTNKGNPVLDTKPQRYTFNRAGGVRCLLLGYNEALHTFILWDADLQDASPGYPYSKGVQAPPSVVYAAVSKGLAEETRRLRNPNRTETIIAARPDRLAEAIERRVDLSIRALTSEVLPGC
ncbi:hypothetical protein ACIODX_14780 [Streptomyces sp. NPDC088190]|uniref:hypothetical protein n=1 Tax=unclassified Streptomyces TaxID=2593676 RepID=UPI002E765CA7|nr:hypothetical protein [Streptomyces sp. JV190]MEE1845361.1 hypothetical protein [Streptomyces sp. JV190]